MIPAEDIVLLHASTKTWRRDAILEAVGGLSLLSAAVSCAIHGDAWHGTLAGIAAGGTLSAAVLTYAKARLWERVAGTREANP